MTATAQAAKETGQQLSIAWLSEDTRAAFLRIVAAVPAGHRFTVNTIRQELDAAQVPERSRAGMFAAACAAGLCKPVTVAVDGVGEVPVSVPSTGESAHRAHVRLYARTSLPLHTPPTTCGECGDPLAPGQRGWHPECFRLTDPE